MSIFAVPPCTATVVGGSHANVGANAVVLSCDERFGFVTRVTLHSLLSNTSWRDFAVCILTDGLSKHELDGFDHLGRRHAVAISVLTAPQAFVNGMPSNARITGATYLRILAPHLLNAQRLLHLDSDIIVQADIRDVFARPRNPAACVSGVIDKHGTRFRRKEFAPGEPYLNTGFLLIEAQRWQEEGVFQKSMQLIESHGTAMRFLEQDVLNIVLQGRKEILPGMWNIQRLDFRPFALRELGDIESFTGVMHFAGEAKPWTRWADPWGQSLYLKYAEPLGLPSNFWREPETIKQKMLEARAADAAGDPARANVVRRDLVRLLLRICGVQTGSRRIDEI